MHFSSIVESLLPTLILIVAGYSLARWMGLSINPLSTLLRYVFLPVYLFMTLKARMSFETFALVALMGSAMVGVGFLIRKNAHRVLKAEIDHSVAIPNIACFSIPLFALSWGGRGLGTACALFVGVSIAAFLLQKKDFATLFKQPWFYAVAAGLVFNEIKASIGLLDVALSPIMGAAYPLLLLFLGASLHPFEGFKDINAWVTGVLRVVTGFLVALLAVSILSVSPAVAAGAVMASMAPPATKALSLASATKETQSSRGPANVGFFVSLALFILFLVTGWNPW